MHWHVRARRFVDDTRSARRPRRATDGVARELNHAPLATRICFLASGHEPHTLTISYAGSARTPRITRPPARLRNIKAVVSRVACMRLLGGVQLALKPARDAGTSLPHGHTSDTCLLVIPPPNAAHHAPPHPRLMRPALRAVACMRLLDRRLEPTFNPLDPLRPPSARPDSPPLYPKRV